MAREILFKAKRIDNGEWIVGDLIHEPFGTYIQSVVDGKRIKSKVIECTICQYTGLADKNGNKIWENDICDRKEKYPEIVKYNEGDFTLDYSYAAGKDYGYNYCNLGFYVCQRKIVEVIGNIFDNPELLEVR